MVIKEDEIRCTVFLSFSQRSKFRSHFANEIHNLYVKPFSYSHINCINILAVEIDLDTKIKEAI